MRHPSRKAVSSVAVLVMMAGALAWLSGCKGGGGDADDDDQTTLPAAQKELAKLSIVNGETAIKLDPATQARLGLSVAALAPTTSRARQTLPAVILSPADLATARSNVLAAQAQLQKARVQADVDNKEYERLKSLYAEDQNISLKSLQAAQATTEADQTDIATAQQQVELQKSLIAQQWGGAVADWAQQNSPAFQRVLDQRDALVQVTIPADMDVAAAKTVAIENLDGSKTDATLVSSFPRVDPRVQGRSFLYVMAPRAPVAPGTSLLADVSVGGAIKGAIVPASAVVWSEGKAWVYEETGASQFTRKAIATNLPLANGYFVSSGLGAGQKVVTVGAQALLSEEFLLRGASTGSNDD
jgi:membrane fusion protein, multidrug efflux system